jgi:hypothetical protein
VSLRGRTQCPPSESSLKTSCQQSESSVVGSQSSSAWEHFSPEAGDSADPRQVFLMQYLTCNSFRYYILRGKFFSASFFSIFCGWNGVGGTTIALGTRSTKGRQNLAQVF